MRKGGTPSQVSDLPTVTPGLSGPRLPHPPFSVCLCDSSPLPALERQFPFIALGHRSAAAHSGALVQTSKCGPLLRPMVGPRVAELSAGEYQPHLPAWPKAPSRRTSHCEHSPKGSWFPSSFPSSAGPFLPTNFASLSWLPFVILQPQDDSSLASPQHSRHRSSVLRLPGMESLVSEMNERKEWQTKTPRLSAACVCFCKYSFIRRQSGPVIYILSYERPSW